MSATGARARARASTHARALRTSAEDPSSSNARDLAVSASWFQAVLAAARRSRGHPRNVEARRLRCRCAAGRQAATRRAPRVRKALSARAARSLSFGGCADEALLLCPDRGVTTTWPTGA